MFRRLQAVPLIVIMAALALTACDQGGQAVPTLFDLNANTTATAASLAQNPPTATPTEVIPTATETSAAPALPPTYTPTIAPTLTPTETLVPTTQIPAGYNMAGTLYYIFNGDSIAALAGDGTHEELIALGGPYSDLAASPDAMLLAYVAPGSGSAREVYITRRDDPAYLQAISCLGMANVGQLAWRPDGKDIAFVASPAVDAARDIYIAGIFGANTCPVGNNLRVFAPLASPIASDPAWSTDGSKFFFSNGGIVALDTATNAAYPFTIPSGFGPDYGLAHSPVGSTLAYLRISRDFQTGGTGGKVFYRDTKSIEELAVEQGGGEFGGRLLRWNRAGTELLVSAEDRFYLFSTIFGTSSQLVTGTGFMPMAVFSPDGQKIAYVDGGAEDPTIPQIYLIDRLGGTPTQITTHPEGTISDLVWLEG